MPTEFAPAKVNLFLRVVGRRADGYHLLDSLAVFPGVGDVLHAEPAEGLSLALAGPFAGVLRAEADNKALTDEAREKKKEQAEERLTQVIEYENTINDKAASRKKQIEDEGRKIQGELAKSIRAAVKTVAAKAGYTFVLEQSGLLANGLEPVLYSDPKLDITDEVMSALNADKPTGKE